MKAMYRIVTPAAATAAAALLLTACADKPVRIPGGAFVDEPYQGETDVRSQTIPSNGSDTLETEIIYIDDDVPVGPVENKGPKGGSVVQSGDQELQPVEQQPETKSNVPEGSVEYKVVKGDTLWGIGMVYGVSVDRLAEVNGIDKNSTLRIGQVLMIPPDAKNAVGKPIPQKKAEPDKAASTSTSTSTKSGSAASTATKAQPVAKDGESLYVVKSGDNLSMIAQRHHVKLADLIAANNVDPKAILRVGQTLVIPAGGKAAASTTTKSGSAATTAKTEPASTTAKSGSAASTAKTEPASTTAKSGSAASTASQSKGGESTGGIVEPIGGSSFGGSPASTPASTAKQPASSGALDPLAPVSAVPDADTISIPTEFEATIEELAAIHGHNLQDLMRLNPSFKPGEKIPAGTIIKMSIY